jgi:sec-independent protein translocase protein TatA
MPFRASAEPIRSQELPPMPSLGVPELIIIFLIIIVLFGASRLPQIGKGMGEGIRNFKRGMKEAEQNPDRLEERTETRNN